MTNNLRIRSSSQFEQGTHTKADTVLARTWSQIRFEVDLRCRYRDQAKGSGRLVSMPFLARLSPNSDVAALLVIQSSSIRLQVVVVVAVVYGHSQVNPVRPNERVAREA